MRITVIKELTNYMDPTYGEKEELKKGIMMWKGLQLGPIRRRPLEPNIFCVKKNVAVFKLFYTFQVDHILMRRHLN